MKTVLRLVCCAAVAAILLLVLCIYVVHVQKGDDRDQDGIPDGQNNGLYVSNPDQTDTDNDGGGDTCDSCPYDYGPASNGGCQEKAQPNLEPDSDKDGIPDSQDACSYEYGQASNKGCPETAAPTIAVPVVTGAIPMVSRIVTFQSTPVIAPRITSVVTPLVTPTAAPRITPSVSNPPGMVINVFTTPDPTGPGTNIVTALTDALGTPVT